MTKNIKGKLTLHDIKEEFKDWSILTPLFIFLQFLNSTLSTNYVFPSISIIVLDVIAFVLTIIYFLYKRMMSGEDESK